MIESHIKLPLISIVVPNHNGAATLERTLQSLTTQNYSNLQVIVIDGGSSDASVSIIRKYERAIYHWESKSDRGQSHAINKGLEHCTGEIVNWINSDDYLLPNALQVIGNTFAADETIDIVNGGCRMDFPHYNFTYLHAPPKMDRILLMPCCCPIAQPSCFFRRRLLQRKPPLDEDNHYAMDFELWNYFLSCGAKWHQIDDLLAVFPYSGENKSCTGGWKIIADHERVYRRYVGEVIPLTFWYRYLRLPAIRLKKYHGMRGVNKLTRLWDRAMVNALSPFYGRDRVTAMDWSAWI